MVHDDKFILSFIWETWNILLEVFLIIWWEFEVKICLKFIISEKGIQRDRKERHFRGKEREREAVIQKEERERERGKKFRDSQKLKFLNSSSLLSSSMRQYSCSLNLIKRQRECLRYLTLK